MLIVHPPRNSFQKWTLRLTIWFFYSLNSSWFSLTTTKLSLSLSLLTNVLSWMRMHINKIKVQWFFLSCEQWYTSTWCSFWSFAFFLQSSFCRRKQCLNKNVYIVWNSCWFIISMSQCVWGLDVIENKYIFPHLHTCTHILTLWTKARLYVC